MEPPPAISSAVKASSIDGSSSRTSGKTASVSVARMASPNQS